MSFNLFAISPIIALTLTGFLVIGLSLAFSRISKSMLLIISLLGLATSAYFSLSLWNENALAFGGMVRADNFSLTFNFIFLIGAALSMMLAFSQHEGGYLLYAEFFTITVFATVGMMLMVASSNLLVIFLGLETLSISLYILVGIKRTEEKSLEAAFKYFLLGAFASGFLLYGIAFIYGAAGSLDLREVANFILGNSIKDNPLVILGGLLIIVGLGFKVAMFPFHMWAPDVYQGAPTPITAFMSTGSKAAGFAAMLRVLFSTTDGTVSDWVTVLWVVSVLTMSFGNIAALVQKNIKRMLAYSSIAHAGYILIGIVAWNQAGASSVVFYLLSYTFMNIGALGVISFLSTKEKEFIELEDFKGLGFQKPVIAVVMAIFMFSLAGLPPTAGFIGKFYLFSAAVKAGQIPLVILGVVNSMISVYYYLGVVVAMFMQQSDQKWPSTGLISAVSLSLLLATVGTLGLGLFPSHWIEMFQKMIISMI